MAASWAVSLDCWLQCLYMASSRGLGSLTAGGLQAIEVLAWWFKAPAQVLGGTRWQKWDPLF